MSTGYHCEVHWDSEGDIEGKFAEIAESDKVYMVSGDENERTDHPLVDSAQNHSQTAPLTVHKNNKRGVAPHSPIANQERSGVSVRRQCSEFGIAKCQMLRSDVFYQILIISVGKM